MNKFKSFTLIMIALQCSISNAANFKNVILENKKTGDQLSFQCMDEACTKMDILFDGYTYRQAPTENLLARLETEKSNEEIEQARHQFGATADFYEVTGYMGWTWATFIPPVIAIPAALVAIDVALAPVRLTENIILKTNLERATKKIEHAVTTGESVQLNDRQFNRIFKLIGKLR